MKPFKPNKQQLEALNKGATKLWIPFSNTALDHFSNSDNLGHDFVWEDPEHIGHFVSGVEVFSPLQPNEEYFVQGELDCPGDCNMSAPCQVCGSNGQFIGTALTTIAKFRVTGAEVKKALQDHTNWSELGIPVERIYPHEEDGMPVKVYNVEQWHDSQYPKQPYSSNPNGFLIGIERIN